MKQRTKVANLCFCALAALMPASVAVEGDRPNVLMIAVDDLNDYISILQNIPGVKTPNFDRLAGTSVNFTRAFCASPLSNPSRGAITTGVSPHQTDIYTMKDLQNKFRDVVDISLTEQFQRHGYLTFTTGKYYQLVWPTERIEKMWTESKPPYTDFGPYLKSSDLIENKNAMRIGPISCSTSAMPDAKALLNTMGWLAQEHDKPFFLVHGISKPHLSWAVPHRFYAMHPLEEIVLPKVQENDLDDVPDYIDYISNRYGPYHFQRILEAEGGNGWQRTMQAYLAAISFADYILGQLLDALEQSKYAGNTIVILWSDNGYHIGEKERLFKSTLWTQATRVPFLIHLPDGTGAGRKCAAPVNLVDIFPTLNELCGLTQPVPQQLSGNSLVPLLKNPDMDWPHFSLTSLFWGNFAVTDARYHYIRYADDSEELYDHLNDFSEFNNLATNAAMQSIKNRLRAAAPPAWMVTMDAKVIEEEMYQHSTD